MRVLDIAAMVRSKNAGPFRITIDLLFPSVDLFEQAAASPALESETIAALLGLGPESLERFVLPESLAMKFTYPRHIPAGSPGDTDVYGCAQAAKIANLSL